MTALFGEVEFDCCECGRHIIVLVGPPQSIAPEPPLCAACLCLPGSVDDPDLRAVIDPDGRAVRRGAI